MTKWDKMVRYQTDMHFLKHEKLIQQIFFLKTMDKRGFSLYESLSTIIKVYESRYVAYLTTSGIKRETTK